MSAIDAPLRCSDAINSTEELFIYLFNFMNVAMIEDDKIYPPRLKLCVHTQIREQNHWRTWHVAPSKRTDCSSMPEQVHVRTVRTCILWVLLFPPKKIKNQRKMWKIIRQICANLKKHFFIFFCFDFQYKRTCNIYMYRHWSVSVLKYGFIEFHKPV